MLLGRNSKCWCGSGEKYKKCHMEFDEKLKEYAKAGYQVPTRDMIKNAEQIEKIKESAKINTAVLDEVAKHIKPGMTTEEINTIVHNFTVEHGAIPAPLGYGGFPKSVCTSINDQICHGIPSEDDVLKEGDIVNVDVSTIYNGYYSDASRMFKIGEVSEEADRLVKVTKECMEMAIANVKPWIPMGIIGATIQEHAHKNGYTGTKRRANWLSRASSPSPTKFWTMTRCVQTTTRYWLMQPSCTLTRSISSTSCTTSTPTRPARWHCTTPTSSA